MAKSKSDKYLIYILLVIIIFCIVCLIIKEIQTPDYDKKEYEKVYEEYNEILEIAYSSQNDNNIISSQYNNLSKNEIKKVSAILEIEKLNMFYPIIQEMTMENLKIAPTKLYGPEANQVGNYCIVGHNYHNDEHFSKLKELENGDVVCLTDKKGLQVKYKVYNKYEINPKDLSCLEQETNGKRELTLITCTNDSKRRLVIKCKEI